MIKRFLTLFLLLFLVFCSNCTNRQPDSEKIRMFVNDLESKSKQAIPADLFLQWEMYVDNGEDFSGPAAIPAANILNDHSLLDKLRILRKSTGDETTLRELEILERDIIIAITETHPEIKALKDTLRELCRRIHEVNAMPNEIQESIPDIGEGIARLFRLRNLVAKDLGYKSYYSLRMYIDNYDLRFSEKLITALDMATSGPYAILLEKLNVKDSLDLGELFRRLATFHQIDLEYDAYFPSEDHIELLDKALLTIGFDLDKLPIYFNLPSTPVRGEGAATFAIQVPYDIRIVVHPNDGYRAFRQLLRESAIALYYSHIGENDFLYKTAPSACLIKAINKLIESLILNTPWLKTVMPLSDELTGGMNLYLTDSTIINVRAMIVSAELEKELYQNPYLDPRRLFDSLFSKIMKSHPLGGKDYLNFLAGHIDQPLNALDNFIAEGIVAQCLYYLNNAENNPDDSLSPKDFMVQYLFSHGRKYDWNDILKKATGETLNIKYYIDRLSPDSLYPE